LSSDEEGNNQASKPAAPATHRPGIILLFNLSTRQKKQGTNEVLVLSVEDVSQL